MATATEPRRETLPAKQAAFEIQPITFEATKESLLERIAAEQRAEAERLAKERAELERQRVEAETRTKRGIARLELLARLGHEHNLSVDYLADLASADWERLHDLARVARNRRDEEAKAEQAKLDRQRQEQEAAQAKIDAEKKRLADEEAARVRAAELEKAKAEAAEKARLDAIAEQERKDAEAKAAAGREAAELARLEALRPDREKIGIFADTIERLEIPALSDVAGNAHAEIAKALAIAAAAIRTVGTRLK